MALDHLGIFHSSSTSGRSAVLGSRILTLFPVALTYPMSTSLLRAVDQKRASGPPPVSSARCLPVRSSYHRGDITQVYLSLKLRFCGCGSVVWFQGCRGSTGLPSGSFSTNSFPFCQSS